ncbi:hypothetical protein H5410_048595 [Solanum commersonii]|uniref:Uncharacterized protein n=1 Tax=Solanum commersonii TaxID=4109 RepID=A0A9J5XIJ9_SOLCO|nr:hypothetical protein H5410_048595 [Solanum commersonii]
MINNGDTVEVYVFHGVSEANQALLELEFVPNMSDSGVALQLVLLKLPVLHLKTNVPPPSPSTVPSSSTVPSPSTVPPPSPSTVPPPSSVPSSDPIIDNDLTDDEVEDESRPEGDTNEDTEVDSDVHQEYIDIRASKRHFKRSQRRSRGTNSDQINVDEKGPDIGYDETNIGIKESLVGKLGGDEPYYISDEAPSFEIDDETAEMKDNIQAMKKVGQECLDDLLWYNLNTWCKKYFQDYNKCDVVDNNMAENFNAWILPAREGGFEIKHHGFTHTMDIVSRSCSYRSWQLGEIPCPNGVAALYYNELEPIHYVASCYSNEMYLSIYAQFIQPMNNMKMWPTSNNPIVKPPKIKKLSGRPTNVVHKDTIKEDVLQETKLVQVNQLNHLLRQDVLVQVSQLNHLLRHRLLKVVEKKANEEQQEVEQRLVVQLNHLEPLHRPPQIMKVVEEEAHEEFQVL